MIRRRATEILQAISQQDVIPVTARCLLVRFNKHMGMSEFDTTQPFGATLALRDALQTLGETRTGTPGRLLFQSGEQVKGVFLLLEGSVTVTLTENGLRYRRTVGPGSVLGLPATMCQKPYSLTAEIVEPLTYVFVACDTVKEFLRTQPELCFQVVEILAREVREMRHATGEAASTAIAGSSISQRAH